MIVDGVQPLKLRSVFAEDWCQFPSIVLGSSQLSVMPAPGDQMFLAFSDTCMHMHIFTYRHARMHIIKYNLLNVIDM